jgi:hypothetical protein
MTSKWHPYSTKSTVPVFVRFSAAPVYASADFNNEFDPVGVLLIGDILNGKAGVIDMVQDQFSDFGFTGLAAYNASSGAIHPLAGVFAPYTQKQHYIYDMQGEYAPNLREAYIHGESEDVQSSINGEVLHYYMKRADLSYRLDTNEDEILLPEFYPPVMLIRGTSVSQWDSFKSSTLAVALAVMLVEFFAMLGTFFLLYRPIHKFVAYMDAQISYKKPKSLNVITKVSNAVGLGNHPATSSNRESTHQNTRNEIQ